MEAPSTSRSGERFDSTGNLSAAWSDRVSLGIPFAGSLALATDRVRFMFGLSLRLHAPERRQPFPMPPKPESFYTTYGSLSTSTTISWARVGFRWASFAAQSAPGTGVALASSGLRRQRHCSSGCQHMSSLQTLANDLAPDLYSAIVVTVADVLQQMGHFGKRAPLPVGGQVLFPLARVSLRIRLRLHDQKLQDTKTG